MDDPALITAWAAVGMAAACFLGQALATFITGLYNLKIRKFELARQRYNSSISEFAATYGKLYADPGPDDIAAFLAAAYNLLSVITGKSITADVLRIVAVVLDKQTITDETNTLFSQVMGKIANAAR